MITHRTSSRTILSLIGGAAAIAVAITAFALGDGPAHAQVAARVESQTRPNFGVLLDPPTRGSRSANRHRYDTQRHRPNPPHPYPPIGYRPGGEEVVLVDCGGNPGSGAVEAAVARLRPGGSLILRSTAGACVGMLQINKPLTIIGDAGLDPRNWDRDAAPTLQAPDGMPCVVVSPGVRVTFRDVVFAAPRAEDAACIVGEGAEILLNRVIVRYTGDAPAIFAYRGLLDLRDVEVKAVTSSPGVVADEATVTADELWVSDAVSGMEITAGDGPTSRLNRVRLVGPIGRSGTGPVSSVGPRPVGLSILASRHQDLVQVSNSKICGYPDGVILEGAKFHIDRSRICGTIDAVSVHGGEALIENSRITASGIAVYADRGTVTVRGNKFGGAGNPTERRRSGEIIAEDNLVWSDYYCRLSYRQIYGNRYAPVWSGSSEGFQCMNTAYPRNWWQKDEEELGIAYNPRLVTPPQYEYYQRGRGWYNCKTEYVDSIRYFDDDRWDRGAEGFDRTCPRPPGHRARGIAGIETRTNIWIGDLDIEFGGRFAIGE